jgi:transferase CAF17, mitochondrial
LSTDPSFFLISQKFLIFVCYLEVEDVTSASTEIVNDESGKKIGTVNKVVGSRGIGLLKIEEAFKPAVQLSLKDREDVKVKVVRPNWWPAEWVQVLDQASAAMS